MALIGRDPLPAAIRALQAELDGGPRAELPPQLETLGALFLERETQALAAEREQPERELLAAIPAPARSWQGRARPAPNTAFDRLAGEGGPRGSRRSS